ncbi:hypothetical protein ACFYPX_15580 [Micromonospora zamorensis]|uniref:hypothetical protein n=1 Tax=Micromonospora zamorensis TaxID=709883 RepID=UPI0036C8BA6F
MSSDVDGDLPHQSFALPAVTFLRALALLLTAVYDESPPVADINNDGLKDLLMANYNYGLVVVPQRPAATSAATSPKVQVGRA